MEKKGGLKKEEKNKIPVKAVVVNKSKDSKPKKASSKKENIESQIDEDVIQLSQESVVSSSQERYIIYMLTYLKCLKSHFCFKEKHYKDQRTELFKCNWLSNVTGYVFLLLKQNHIEG